MVAFDLSQTSVLIALGKYLYPFGVIDYNLFYKHCCWSFISSCLYLQARDGYPLQFFANEVGRDGVGL